MSPSVDFAYHIRSQRISWTKPQCSWPIHRSFVSLSRLFLRQRHGLSCNSHDIADICDGITAAYFRTQARQFLPPIASRPARRRAFSAPSTIFSAFHAASSISRKLSRRDAAHQGAGDHRYGRRLLHRCWCASTAYRRCAAASSSWYDDASTPNPRDASGIFPRRGAEKSGAAIRRANRRALHPS